MKGEKRRCINVPQEIGQEILVKLPVKSLARFKAVSTEWRGTIESKYFIEKHNRYQKSLQVGQVRIVLFSEEKRYNGLALQNMLVSASGIDVHVSPYLLPPIRAFNRFDGYKISEPCDGLICLYTYSRIFNLVNPATTSRRRIPDPTPPYSFNGGHDVLTLLGIGREKNSVSPRYKLVWFFDCDIMRRDKSPRCMVFALDSNTWRYVDPPRCRVYYRHSLIHLDGVMYCFADHMEKTTRLFEEYPKLLALDLHTETFQIISITPDIGCRYCHELSMCVLNRRICIFKRFVDDKDCFFKIWGLDMDKRSWETMYSIDLSCFPPEFKVGKRIIPVATINDYVIISNFDRTIWVLYSSKSCILCHTSFDCHLVMSYFETLVSTYQ